MTHTMLATEVNAQLSAGQFPPPRPEQKRFTLDGDGSLETHLAAICTKIARRVKRIVPRRKLEALLLGGGYGRGEGGVLRTSNGDQPYNDLEFYVLIAGNRFLNRRRYAPALDQLAHESTQAAGVEVEFHIMSAAQLHSSAPSMFYHDLVVGHQQLCGSPQVLGHCPHHRKPSRLPAAEATRLLMNRGTGLLLAREKLSAVTPTGDDRDFIARNIAKAQLALGDAVLTVCGQYHWSCRDRNCRLARLDHAVTQERWFNQICRAHEAGVEFKLHPHRSDASAAELKLEHQNIVDLMAPVWLWTESQRLKTHFSSARQYATSLQNKCPETNPWRNLLLNARIFGPRIMVSQSARRHPRERIFNALSILLWDDRNSAELLRRFLQTDSDPWSAYQKLWACVR